MAGIQIDGVNNKIDFDDDADTSISSATDDTLIFEIAGTNTHSMTSSLADFNTQVAINVTGNEDTLILKSTDDDANTGPILKLLRDSGSPADNDLCAVIKLNGDNDANEDTQCYEIRAAWNDVSNGTEDGAVRHALMVGGTLRDVMTLDSGITVFNDDSQDIDFRIESNDNANAFKVDAGNNQVHLGTSSSFGTFLNISGGSTHDIAIENSTNNKSQMIVKNTSTSNNTQIMILQSARNSTAHFEFYRFISNDGSDVEHLADGAGAYKIDGVVTTGGIDYAEYFEWKDGNSSDEDRRGHSVITDGNKIVVATSSDDASKIIGIVSTNPTVLGDADIERWMFKYERDEYGSLVWEEHTVTEWTEKSTNENEDDKKHSYQTDKIPAGLTVPSDATVISEEEDRYGNTIKLKRKKLNPEWDSSKQYVSREDRKEWEAIGLVGKLRLKKGQPTNPNWIKLRDISDTVEEWLVR